jgi:hypothetical protein
MGRDSSGHLSVPKDSKQTWRASAPSTTIPAIAVRRHAGLS